ncbi:hypothetical protein IKG13_00735 [Candidatus Saccharibacteria bacterium]|nr:hypothetical protein [Candidatus Saccharibacteria bacterium]
MTTENNKNHPIKIIDDNTKTWYGALLNFLLCLYVLSCTSTIAALVTFSISSSRSASAIAALIAFCVTLIAWLKYRSSSKEKVNYTSKVIDVSEDEHKTIQTLLRRYGSISSFRNSGDIARVGEHFKPRGMLEPYDEFFFIRLDSDNTEFSSKERKIILKIFGYEEKDNVIWFYSKDKKPLQVTYFYTEDGTKMKFIRGLHCYDHDFKAIELMGDECVLHIFGNYY